MGLAYFHLALFQTAGATPISSVSAKARGANESGAPQAQVSEALIRRPPRAPKDTRIKFMTDGILLREVQADFLCQKRGRPDAAAKPP